MKIPDNTPWWLKMVFLVIFAVIGLFATVIAVFFGFWFFALHEVVK